MRQIILSTASRMSQLVPTTAESLPLVVTKTSRLCVLMSILKAVLDEVEAEIQGSSWNPYIQDLQQWKLQILRSINQDVLKMEDSSSALIIMDLAMKFLQLKYRERQCDWYGIFPQLFHSMPVLEVCS